MTMVIKIDSDGRKIRSCATLCPIKVHNTFTFVGDGLTTTSLVCLLISTTWNIQECSDTCKNFDALPWGLKEEQGIMRNSSISPLRLDSTLASFFALLYFWYLIWHVCPNITCASHTKYLGYKFTREAWCKRTWCSNNDVLFQEFLASNLDDFQNRAILFIGYRL